jgi:GT2 family glycosyltransferase
MTTTTQPRVAIIILTWNGLSLTRRCLETLRALPAGAPFRIIVVDNGSTDGTLEWLRAQPDVELIANAENVGYTRGNNQGLRALRAGEDALLLNNDTEIIQEGWLARLQAAAYGDERAGVVGCRQISPDGLLLHVGTYMPTHTLHGYQVGGDEVDVGQYPGVREVEGVVGSCMYIRHDCLAEVGPLDEQFFSYYEDTDYCLRARKAGWKVLCAGDVTIVHAQNASTAVNRVSLNAMFARSQAIFVKKWVEQYGRQYRRRLFWHGVVGGYSSYAVLSRQFVLALDAAGVDVRLGYLYGVDFWEGEERDPRVAQLKARPKDLSLPQVVCHQGDVFYKNSGRYKIGFTMMDVDGLDEEWVRQCNELHEVWVPSEWSRQTFAESGVRVPIHLVPLGVDTNYFHPGIRSKRFGPRYTFLSVFEWGERKAPEVLLRAWAAAFTKRDDVQLVLKITNNDASVDVAAQIAALDLPKDMAPLVILYNENIPGAQMGSLYRAADCFVLASRGEGWGMPVLEAMACGLPTIATDFGGTTAFLREGVAYPLRVGSLIPAVARCRYYPGFRWAEPDVEHLVHLLRHAYQHQDEARAVGERAATYAQEWTWEKAAVKIVERLEAIGD